MMTTINSPEEFNSGIEQLGIKEAMIKDYRRAAKRLRVLLEEYIAKHASEVNETGETLLYHYSMKKAEPALRMQPQLKESEIVERMERDTTFKHYVKKVWDAERIKTDYANSDNSRDVENVGLFFTVPKPHLYVEAKM